MPMIVIEPPTEEEIRQYKKYKEILRVEASVNTEKQAYKKAKAIIQVGKIRAGMCPTCGHCLIWGDATCDECFQKVKWYD